MNHTFRAGHQKRETHEISPRANKLVPLPESPPGSFAPLLLLRVRGALPLHRAVAALGAGASLLQRTVEAVAVGAVGALVTLRPDRTVWRYVPTINAHTTWRHWRDQPWKWVASHRTAGRLQIPTSACK